MFMDIGVASEVHPKVSTYIHPAQAPDNPTVTKSRVDDEEEPVAKGRRKPRLLLELPHDVKEAVDRSAFANARTRTAEIVLRLRQSLEVDPMGAAGRGGVVPADRRPAIASWLASPGRELGEDERHLLTLYKGLTEGQRQALLILLADL